MKCCLLVLFRCAGGHVRQFAVGPDTGKAGGLGPSCRAGQFVAVAWLVEACAGRGGLPTTVKTDGVGRWGWGVIYGQIVCECRLALVKVSKVVQYSQDESVYRCRQGVVH